jgi:hypothetical protein
LVTGEFSRNLYIFVLPGTYREIAATDTAKKVRRKDPLNLHFAICRLAIAIVPFTARARIVRSVRQGSVQTRV